MSRAPSAILTPAAQAGIAPGTIAGNPLVRFAAVALQVVLLAGLFRLFNLENAAFEMRISALVVVGFFVHHFTPAPWRMSVFAAISLGSVWLVSWSQPALALWITGMGMALIGACHLPVPFLARLLCVVALSAVFAALRLEWAPMLRAIPVPGAVWPILGSIFMFRLVNYLYDLRHKTAPFSPARAIAYFFMVPNVCFTLFPVVDYKTFCRNHYNDDAIRIYQVGATWVFRGVVQLLIYRWIYLRWAIAPGEAVNMHMAVQYILATFGLYLKVSGTFHLIIGLVRLFGFNLPETHHLYFFSSSFTDFWRRINIYWKDFIQKIVFYPLYFRLKRIGEGRAVVVATLLAFVITWLLHSYQWFWIRARFPITWSDAVFWLGLGVLVVINMRWEARKGRPRRLPGARPTRADLVRKALAIAGTFAAISALWTVWYTPDIHDLRAVAIGLTRVTPLGVALIIGVPLGIGALGAWLGNRQREHTEGIRARGAQEFHFWRSAAIVIGGAILVAGIGKFPGQLPLPQPMRTAVLQGVEAVKMRHLLNRRDRQTLERGYYEDLGDVGRFNPELATMLNGRPVDWGGDGPEFRDRDDLLLFELDPGRDLFVKRVRVSINALGMRDTEYTQEPQGDAFRIAIAGSSHDYASGVEQAHSYDARLEALLNAQRPAGPPIEVVNLSVPGYSTLQKTFVLERVAPPLKPRLLLFVMHSNETEQVVRGMARYAATFDPIPEPFLADVARRAGCSPKDSHNVLESKFLPFTDEIIGWCMDKMASARERLGIQCVVLLLPKPSDVGRTPLLDQMTSMAQSRGLPVLDATGAFDGVADRTTLWITAWDNHTNAAGHAMIADRLSQLLNESGLVPQATPAAEPSGTAP